MKRLPAMAVLPLLLMAPGCGGSDASNAPVLKAGGSTFVYPAMAKWAQDYRMIKKVEVSYQSIGSGAGIHGMIDKNFDFGCTDGPLNDEELKQARKSGGEVVHIPLILGAVVPSYNLPEVTGDLAFTGEVLADIYLGKVKKWNDAALRGLNPEVNLPDRDIIVVHRLDGSGTTYVWADYLSKVSPEWKQKVGVGTSLQWPCGLAERGNDGVSRRVHDTDGTLGYIELTYALQNGVQYGSVKNKDGHLVKGTRSGVIAAAESALPDIPDDLRFSLTNLPGEHAYPISGASWAIVYVNQPADKGREIVDFLRWITHDGQLTAEQLRYARLPDSLVQRLEKKLDQIMAGK